jgi:hypothetical protein
MLPPLPRHVECQIAGAAVSCMQQQQQQGRVKLLPCREITSLLKKLSARCRERWLASGGVGRCQVGHLMVCDSSVCSTGS